MNELAEHIERLLATQDEHGQTGAEQLATSLFEAARKGDALSLGLIIRLIVDYRELDSWKRG